MKLLPLYVNCLIKSDVLAGGSEVSSDDRAFLMQACLSMSPAVSSAYFYPRVLALVGLKPCLFINNFCIYLFIHSFVFLTGFFILAYC